MLKSAESSQQLLSNRAVDEQFVRAHQLTANRTAIEKDVEMLQK